MSEQSQDDPSQPPAAAAVASASATDNDDAKDDDEEAGALPNIDIRKILSSQGPTIKCVLLRTDNTVHELQIDMTPKKSMVAKTLGGPFTFLGQYEDEGVMLMIRRQPEESDGDDADDGNADDSTDITTLSIKELRQRCQSKNISTENMLEKSDLIRALAPPPVNPHSLQPPFDQARVHGDILIVKVAEDAADMDNKSNEEFFLDYTKEEYLLFAARTDVVAPEVVAEAETETEIEADADAAEETDDEDGDAEQEEGNNDNDNGDNDDDDDEDEDDDDAYNPAEDGEFDPENMQEGDKAAVLNMLMNEVLRQYREEHGRGPDTLELLEIRAMVAERIEIEVPQVDAEQSDWTKKAKKRPRNGGDGDDNNESGSDDSGKRRVVFSPEVKKHDGERPIEEGDDGEGHEVAEHHETEEEDAKPPAKRLKMDPAETATTTTEESEAETSPGSTTTIETASSPSKIPAEAASKTVEAARS